MSGTPASADGARGRGLAWALATVLGALCLFAGKAYTIDDTLFLKLAQHLQDAPLDPYGFQVNWYTASEPMYAVTKNPPLTGYLIALAAAVVGWSEVALHLVFLVPAAAVVACTYRLAQRFSRRPLTATWAALLTPVFLVSSTNVMCDTLQLAFWCGGVLAWVRGLDRERAVPLWLAGGLAGLGVLTKYFAIALVPLLFAYGLARRRRLGAWALPLLLPLSIALAYELLTWRLYPGLDAPLGLLSDAVLFSGSARQGEGLALVTRGWVGLTFAGGCVASALFVAPLVWSRAATGVALVVGAALAAWILTTGALWDRTFLEIPAGWTPAWALTLQGTLLALGGASLLALAATDLARERSPEALLLFLWVAGTFAFAAFLNWVNNGRSNLPLAPAVGLLIARRLDALETAGRVVKRAAVGVALGLTALLALCVAAGDAAFANSVRRSVARLRAEHMEPTGLPTVFLGHWGFQWYMEAAGAQAWEYGVTLPPGVLCVLPQNNVDVWLRRVGPDFFQRRADLHPPARWIHTVSNHARAGFYASNQGRLPFAFGPSRQDRYLVLISRRAFRPYHDERTREVLLVPR